MASNYVVSWISTDRRREVEFSFLKLINRDVYTLTVSDVAFLANHHPIIESIYGSNRSIWAFAQLLRPTINLEN